MNSDKVIVAIIFAAIVVLAMIFYVIIFMINDYSSTKKTEKKAPSTHQLLVDLQHEMLKELKGTSRQNMIMIELTVLFILISIFGMILGIEGPQKSAKMLGQAGSYISLLISNVMHGYR
jgi:predicted permease